MGSAVEIRRVNFNNNEIILKVNPDIDFVQVKLDSDNCNQDPVIFGSKGSYYVSPTTEEQTEFKSKFACLTKFGGILLALLAASLFSLTFCIVKLLPAYHAFSISFWRQFGNVIPSIPILIYAKCQNSEILAELRPLNKKWTVVAGLLVQAFLSSSGLILRFYSLDYLTVADSTVLTYGGPIFVIVLGHIILGEKSGVIPILISIWCLLGVCVITRPPILTGGDSFNQQILIGTGIILLVVFLQSTMTILIRKTRHQLHFAILTFTYGIFGLIQSGIVAYSFNVFSIPNGLEDILLHCAVAIFSFIGQLCMILALKLEEAGLISLVLTTDALFAFPFQTILLQQIADLFSYIGASIVLTGVGLAAFRKWLNCSNEDFILKRRLWFLLK